MESLVRTEQAFAQESFASFATRLQILEYEFETVVSAPVSTLALMQHAEITWHAMRRSGLIATRVIECPDCVYTGSEIPGVGLYGLDSEVSVVQACITCEGAGLVVQDVLNYEYGKGN